jgi:membrane-bound lytic murein transglycosylase F
MLKREKMAFAVAMAIVVAVLLVGTPFVVPQRDVDAADTLEAESAEPVFCISPYDSLFRVYADTVGWDWKMLAAVAYVESKFDTAAVSNVGALGLMQIMPVTARAMGVPEGMESNPDESVRAAAEYFAYLSRLFRHVPESERVNFVLASYNAGFGHVHDAMRLAHKYGKDRHVWNDNVEVYLRLKNDSIYYTDSLCRNGRFAGLETLLFVRRVQSKYGEYCMREDLFFQDMHDAGDESGGVGV